MAKFMSNISYASDEEWFRYLVINFACCCILSGFNIYEYFDFKSGLDFYTNTILIKYKDATQCVVFFNLNLWSNFVNTIIITFVCSMQIYMIVQQLNSFFINNNTDNTAFKEESELIVYSS